jgi:hypothetical protein
LIKRRAINIDAADVKSNKAVGQVRSALDEVQQIPLLNGVLLEDITITAGQTKSIAHKLGRKPKGVIVVLANTTIQPIISSSDDTFMDMRFSVDWEEIGYEYVSAATNSVTFTGLDGDVDCEYKLAGKVVNDSGAAREYNFRPNGLTGASSTSDGQKFASSNSTSTSSDPGGMMFAYFSWAEGWFEAHLCAETGAYRQFNVVGCSGTDPGTVDTAIHNYCGTWSDTTTNITSIEIYQNSSDIDPGSWFRLYRRPKSATANLWVF